MAFHAFHTLSFPRPALEAGSECEVAECMVRRVNAKEKFRMKESLRQCIRPLGGEFSPGVFIRSSGGSERSIRSLTGSRGRDVPYEMASIISLVERWKGCSFGMPVQSGRQRLPIRGSLLSPPGNIGHVRGSSDCPVLCGSLP